MTMRIRTLLGFTLALACGNGDRAYKGRSASSWSAQLEARTPDDRMAAADALYHIAPRSPEVVEALLKAVRDTNPQVQSAVAVALAAAGPQAVPGLVVALQDDHANVRALAIRLLVTQGSAARANVTGISARLSDSEEFVRREAALALGQLGRVARESAPALVMCSRTGTPELRATCMHSLAVVSVLDPALRGIAEASLGDAAAVVRRAAVSVLASIDTGDGSHAVWRRLAKDPDPSVRLAVFQGLRQRSATSGDQRI